MSAPIVTPELVWRLSTRPALLAAIRILTKAAITAGELPGRRGIPEGDEAAAWIGKPAAPVAFATFFDGGHNRVWLDILYVRPEMRRRGCGRALLAAVEQAARARGYDQIVFGTAIGNSAMRGAGGRAGYEERYIDLVKEIGAGETRRAP